MTEQTLTEQTVEIIKSWIAALRSGKYKQGIGQLKADEWVRGVDGTELFHCCLGVLCELAVEQGIIGPSTQRTEGSYHLFGHNCSTLPFDVKDWASLGLIGLDVYTLMDMNDVGRPFEEIADFIEAHLVKHLDTLSLALP